MTVKRWRYFNAKADKKKSINTIVSNLVFEK